MTPLRRSSRPSVSSIARWSAVTRPGLAMTSTSQPGRTSGAIDRSTSRSRRRTRFRTTAEPRALLVARPYRVDPRSVRRTRVARRGWDRIVPRSTSAAKSCGLEIITRRGGRVPRSVVRPTGACDREPGVRPGRGVRPSSSSGRGSRVPWRGGASWAGRSASSCLRGILSVGPRGSVILDPERHANAPAPPRGVARSSFGDDRSGPKRVSNEPEAVLAGPGAGAEAGPREVARRPGQARSRYSRGVSRNCLAAV